MLYKNIKKNTNPDARKFKKNVKKIEKFLDNDKTTVFKNRKTIITKIDETSEYFEQAKNKSLKYHKNFEEYRRRFYKTHELLNKYLFNISKNKLTNYKIEFDKSIKNNNIENADNYADSMMLLYKTVSWKKGNTSISEIEKEYEKSILIISDIEEYTKIINEMKNINSNTSVIKIAALYVLRKK